MPILTAKVGNKHFRLKKSVYGGYDIQEKINGLWNNVDSFDKMYSHFRGCKRPWGYLGYSFSNPGDAFNEFVKRENKEIAVK